MQKKVFCELWVVCSVFAGFLVSSCKEDVYVLDSRVDVIDGREYKTFSNPVYETVEWCDKPVLCSYTDSYNDVHEFSYEYPDSVIVDWLGERSVAKLEKGLVSFSYGGGILTGHEYDSEKRLIHYNVIMGPDYKYYYDDNSWLEKIVVGTGEDGMEAIIDEYTSIPARTLSLMPASLNQKDPWCSLIGSFADETLLTDVGFRGKTFADCLVKRIKIKSRDGYVITIEYDYELDSNGYLKDVQTKMIDPDGHYSVMKTTFTWRKL